MRCAWGYRYSYDNTSMPPPISVLISCFYSLRLSSSRVSSFQSLLCLVPRLIFLIEIVIDVLYFFCS